MTYIQTIVFQISIFDFSSALNSYLDDMRKCDFLSRSILGYPGNQTAQNKKSKIFLYKTVLVEWLRQLT